MLILPEDVILAFCPTGPGGGVDPTCSPANAGTGSPAYQYQNVRVLRVNQWPEVNRRALRALQSRLSRAIGEPAKEAVRRQIIALRNRVNAVHAALRSPINQPAAIAQAAAAHAAAQSAPNQINWVSQAATAGMTPVAPPLTKTPQIASEADLQEHLSNLTDPPEYDANWRPLEMQIESKQELSGLFEKDKTAFNSAMQAIFGEHVTPAEHTKLLLSAAGADKRITALMNRADVKTFGGNTSFNGSRFISLQLKGEGITMHRTFEARADGTKHASNEYFTLSKQKQGDGIGIRAFSQQVASLTEKGFTSIKTQGAKSGGMVGYAVWPKFGYGFQLDGPGGTMRGDMEKAGVYKKGYSDEEGRTWTDSQATLATKEGSAFWAKEGSTTNMTFKLDPKRYASHAILNTYRAKKISELQTKLENKDFIKLAFCPTGPGGGVDPTCSPHGASVGGIATLTQATILPVLNKAKGTKNWPDAAKKKLRALQSKLSRAKTAEAKAIVIKAINAHIAAQNAPALMPLPTPAQLAGMTSVAAANAQKAATLAAYKASQVANAAALEAKNKGLTKVDAKIAAELKAQAQAVAAWYTTNPTDGAKVREYTATGFHAVNKALRYPEAHANLSDAALRSTREMTASIDKLMSEFAVPKELIVTRAVGKRTQAAWKEGYVHEEKGYVSCSATAVRHVGYLTSWDKQTRCIISVPKGIPGAYLTDISAYPKEKELLLGRGLKFRVTRREENVPKDRAAELLYNGRPGGTAQQLQHQAYTIIHMTVEQ